MRSHELRQLDIAGREKALALEPEFDFYRASRVIWLAVQLDADALPRADLHLEYCGVNGCYDLALVFGGVRELVLPELRPFLFLPELEVEDLRGCGLEGIRFEIVSHFERTFRCACAELAIADFRPT